MEETQLKKWGMTIIVAVVVIAAIIVNFYIISSGKVVKPQEVGVGYKLVFPSDKYPETGKHIREAIAKGESKICTIDRGNAEEHRKESLKGIQTKKGFDRDEWPMAMCAEGGAGADIEYVTPSDNRGAGSWIGNQLDSYPDGTRVEIIVN
jgi:hypothetical protein